MRADKRIVILVVGGGRVIHFSLHIPGSKENVSYANRLKGDYNPVIETVTITQAPLGCVNRKTLPRPKMGQKPTRLLCVVWAPHQGGRPDGQQSLGEKEATILWGEGRQAGFSTIFRYWKSS